MAATVGVEMMRDSLEAAVEMGAKAEKALSMPMAAAV